jgi:ribose transport system substrate-binding protein
MRLGLVVCVMSAAMAAAGCSSGSPSGSGTGQSGTGGSGGTTSAAAPGVAEAKNAVAALQQAPRALSIPPLSKVPPKRESVYAVGCGLPECQALVTGWKAAAAAFGWTLHVVNSDLSPEGTVSAWNQAVAARPAVIFSLAMGPTQLIASQLEQAAKNGTKTVLTAIPQRVGTYGISAIVGGTAWYASDGVALADWAIADSNGHAHVVFVEDPTTAMLVKAVNAGKAEIAKLCRTCTSDVLTVQNAQAGKVIPGQVLSYLQKHPDVNYVLSPVSSEAIGVGLAIRSGGLHVRLATSVGQLSDLQAVSNGLQAATVTNEFGSLSYRMVDIAARLIVGDPIPASLGNAAGEKELFDSNNIATASLKKPWDVPGVAATFAKAWRA